jgi:putative endonuclease
MNHAAVRVIGALGEAMAEEYFKSLGATILARNYRVEGGELDLVVLQDHELVAVEVKVRGAADLEKPEEAINHWKLRRLVHALTCYASEADLLENHWRIDLIAIETRASGELERFEHIPDIYPP